MARKTNQTGIDLIKEYEGLRLEAYHCSAGVLTIGYGHTGDVTEGACISEEEAEKLLQQDLARFEKAVDGLVEVDISDDEFAALVSFCYNLGEGNLKSSTLLKCLNGCEYQKAADEFPKWRKADGKVLPGLVKRRAAERELFLKGMASRTKAQEVSAPSRPQRSSWWELLQIRNIMRGG
jgi:lysozyme